MKRVATKTADIILHDEGYVFFRYQLFAEVDVKEAKADHEAAKKLTGGKKLPALVDARSLVSMTHKARAFAASPDVAKISTAAAIVVDSSVSSVLANMFLRFSRPPYPVKTFTDEQAAMKWLGQYFNKDQNPKSQVPNPKE